MNGNTMLKRLLRSRKGFTLIELMIVVSIIGILATIAVPNYKWGLIRAREAVLRENLYNMRNTLDQFYADQGKFPDSLQELVDKAYLREIPRDPFTGKNDSWTPVPPPSPPEGNPPPGNVYDVHSGSELVGTDGKPYRDW